MFVNRTSSVRLKSARLSGRRPGLRLELVRWKEDAGLLVLLFEKKRTSIYARSPSFAALSSGACPAGPFGYLCAAGPPRTGKLQPKYGPFGTERRAQTDFTVQPGCTANSRKGLRAAPFLFRLTVTYRLERPSTIDVAITLELPEPHYYSAIVDLP